MKTFLLCTLLSLAATPARESKGFAEAVQTADRALGSGDLDRARVAIDRALERDSRSPIAWDLRARWAQAQGDQDELVYALHKQLRLLVAQKAERARIEALKTRLSAVDPLASDLYALQQSFIGRLLPLAEQYEKDKRPHSAIRVYKRVLAFDPDHVGSQQAIERLTAVRDPSLAEDAKPKDLLADVSKEWIREHDQEHDAWGERAILERDNYITETDAGYECLVRAAEAMEQMNAFYRAFFRYGTEEDGKTVPRIQLVIFKSRDEYLELGSGPPVKWSGGQFTGGSVETYVGQGGFQDTVNTLFHEAAHQFVSLATNAAGWLNEGMASFFEGCRLLPNGSVIMNEPADHYLGSLTTRMERGWMSHAGDGIDPSFEKDPETAPTFRLVLENEYEWGPPWYAPTWGVVFFLYNYQDPIDGRFVFRDAFRVFVDASGGKVGKTAIKTFEETVLAKPKPPIKGFKRPDGSKDIALPKTVDELSEVWKSWLTELQAERSGKLERKRPFLTWARAALLEKNAVAAQEHFEKGVVAAPDDVELLLEFADFLAGKKNTDRASKLVLRALQALEAQEKPNEQQLRDADRLLDKWDPKHNSIDKLHADLALSSKALVSRYQAAKLPLMVMDLSWRLGTDHDIPELFELYEEAAQSSKKTLLLWELAYNETDLDGWGAMGDSGFTAEGNELAARFGEYAPDKFDYQILTLDRVTGGDFSMEAELQTEQGKCAFAGLVFGRKGASAFHAFILFPGTAKTDGTASSGFVDLTSFFGSGAFKTWRHTPVETAAVEAGETSAGTQWRRLRIDVTGRVADIWYDGQLLATQEFASLDILRGQFGLVIGPGSARFRNVRYLARVARDRGAQIERGVRIAEVKKSGGPVGGSYLDTIPPFPKVKRWAQGSRASWAEKGPVPQLLVLWSIQQNDLVPIDGWLCEIAERGKDLGLEIVNVASPNDDEKLDTYLKEHLFPGTVAVDFRDPQKYGLGDTNELYFTRQFNLPRVLLIDLDQSVYWEGDPGWSRAEPWTNGAESYLDAPLAELVEKRRIRELRAFHERWPAALAALHEGNFAAAGPVLLDSLKFSPRYSADAADARKKLDAVAGALGALSSLADAFQRDEVEPALPVLVEWGKAIGKTAEKKALTELKPKLESKAIKAWNDIPKQVEAWRKKIKKLDGPAVTTELVAKLEAVPVKWARAMFPELKAAIEARDMAQIDALLSGHERRAALWLARDYFAW